MARDKGRLIVVSGPSGAGKTTLLKQLLEKHNDKICFSVSHTTRAPRRGEVDGKDYHFVSVEEFKNGIKNDIFLEYALVHDNYYGTSKEQIESIKLSNRECILDIDVQGGVTLREKKVDAVYIFVAPPSVEVLRERLLNRSTDAIDVINKRVDTAKKELEQKDKYDFIIVNNTLQNAYNELEEIILRQ